jgi:Holliday junction resolvase RusA-like endonuclease
MDNSSNSTIVGGQQEAKERFAISEVIHTKLGRHLKIIIAGQPCALQRPRFQWRANNSRHRGGVYTRNSSPKITVWNPNYEEQSCMRRCIEGVIRPRLDAAGRQLFFQNKTGLSINIVFYMPRPNHHFHAGMEHLYENVQLQYRTTEHIRTPDIDNLVKFALDKPMEGIVYGNDSHITSISARKVFDNVGDCSGRILIDVTSAPVPYPIDVDNLPK